MYTTQLQALAAMSNQYGADSRYVLAGGGNTSFKSADHLWVKGSGTALATIRPEDFVVLERALLDEMWTAQYPQDEDEREAAVLSDMMNARVRGENRRPSVETLLHNLFAQQYVLHVHPTMVNGLTCSKEGKAAMQRLFPDAVWVDACKPGYILALECKKVMDAYQAQTGKQVEILFLQNHGIFFAADTREQLDRLIGLCEQHGFFQISGEDINSPRQSFRCKALDDPAFGHLIDATYALIGYETAASENLQQAKQEYSKLFRQ